MPKRKDVDAPEKKSKASKKARADESDGGGSDADSKPQSSTRTVKKPRVAPPTDDNASAEDADYIDLGKKKRVSVSEFKGTYYVNIREYYEDRADGELKPGKKGITLSAEQWDAFKSNIDVIDSAFKKASKKK